MDVILLERVGKLGNLGEVVTVKSGFARNFLIPQGKALRASKENLAVFEAQRADLEKRNQDLKSEAEELGKKLDGETCIVIRAASDAGALYGSVTPRDIADSLSEKGLEIDRSTIALDGPIKELGIHTVRAILHPEVIVELSVNVARSSEEAELQASGKTIQSLAADAEAEAEAELNAMLDEVGKASQDEDDSGAEEASE